jgi:1-acyl-sn-glycerol-3-phosphate acyltransferase
MIRARSKCNVWISKPRTCDHPRVSLDPIPLPHSLAGRAGMTSILSTLRALGRYHRHQIVGFEHVPTDRAFLMVSNHSLATYDAFIAGVEIYDRLGILVHPILDRTILDTPVLGDALREMGFLDGDREAAVAALEAGSTIGVIPGGMRESLRPSTRKFEVDWKGRTGFVRVAMQAGVPILLSACPRGDDIYDIADSPITKWVYSKFRLPFPLARGLGPTFLPKPVQLTAFFSEPIESPVPKDEVTDEAVAAHHAYLTERMNEMLRDGAAQTASR